MIEFDPEKDAANIAKHGVSLGLADRIEMDDAIIVIDGRRNYGEVRYITVRSAIMRLPRSTAE